MPIEFLFIIVTYHKHAFDESLPLIMNKYNLDKIENITKVNGQIIIIISYKTL